jgi:hypothetical protein
MIYGEAKIVFDLHKENYRDYFYRRFMGIERFITEHDTIFTTFEDTVIFESTAYEERLAIVYKNVHCPYELPNMIKSLKGNIYKRIPWKDDTGVKILSFDNVFKDCIDYDNYVKDVSCFNCIFHDYLSEDVFGLVKIKSCYNSPRFKFAYNDAYLDVDDVNYVINCIFRNLSDK